MCTGIVVTNNNLTHTKELFSDKKANHYCKIYILDKEVSECYTSVLLINVRFKHIFFNDELSVSSLFA